MATQAIGWASDVKVSMPQPLSDDNPGLVPMDGFTFTASGLAHDISRAEWARISVPTLAPVNPSTNTVRYDADLDSAVAEGA
jgi:hypothetical protein